MCQNQRAVIAIYLAIFSIRTFLARVILWTAKEFMAPAQLPVAPLFY